MTDAGPSWESLPQSELTAEQILDGLVDLVTGARSMRDVTPESIGRALNLELRRYDDGDVGSHARLTPDWSYAVRLLVDLADGPMLRLSFMATDRADVSSRAELPGLELDEFADRLVGAGFDRERQYGEHDRVLGDDFVRDELTLHVAFGTTTTDGGSPRHTIRWVTVD